MKVSLNWIKQFTDVPLPIDKLVEKIGAQLGAIEGVEYLGEKYKGAVVAKVVTCVKHPNADKLSLCMINDGGAIKHVKRNKDSLVQVVCGAPNVAAGQLVVWLPPGVIVPSTFGKDPFVLEAREIRGQISNGMIASAKELDLGDDHTGILVIDGKVRPGTSLLKALDLDDYIVTIENKMFTHRPDCFGMLGVAREIAGIQGKPFKSPAWYRESPTLKAGSSKPAIKVQNAIPDLVPRFCALPISVLKVAPSPAWMQSYLARVGVRPINNIVDITNFTMLASGQPLHAYDADKLVTGTLGVRFSHAGEKLKLIGGKEIKLQAGAIVITDGVKPVGLGGVMGGADTQVDETTKNIILEAATFDMNLTRKAAMQYGLLTDAATRFTKNQSPRQNLAALSEAALYIKTHAKGNVDRLVDEKHLPKPAGPIHVPTQFINERLGLSLSAIEMKRLLDNVEFKVRRDAGKLAITPPFWRTDIEQPEDIVEEIGRLYGYDHLPQILPSRSIAPVEVNAKIAFKAHLRDILVRAGANETLTYSFVHGSLLDSVGQNPAKSYHIKNALSPNLQYYRQNLTPSLLEKIHQNIKAGYDEFALFEIGKGHVVGKLDDEKLPAELEQVALVRAGRKGSGGAPYFGAKAICRYVLDELNIAATYEPLGDSKGPLYLEPTRSAIIKVNGQTIGFIGEFKPDVARQLKLPAACAGFSLAIDELMAVAQPLEYQPLNKYPELEQDICLRTQTRYSYAELEQFVNDCLRRNAKPHGYLVQLTPIDIFQKPNEPNHKQTTWRVSLSHPERTLTTDEANRLLDALAAEAQAKLKADRI